MVYKEQQEEQKQRQKLKREKVKESVPEGYFIKKEMSELLGISVSQVNRLCYEGILDSVKINNKIYISKEEKSKYLDYKERRVEPIPKGYISKKEMSEILGISYSNLEGLCKKGVFNIIKVNNKVYIPIEDHSKYSAYKKQKEEQKILRKLEQQKEVPEKYIPFSEIALLFNISRQKLWVICKKLFLDIKNINNTVYIKKDNLEKIESFLNEKNSNKSAIEVPKGYLNINDLSKVLNVSHNTCYNYIKNGELKNVLKINRKTYIQKQEVDEFLEIRKLKNRKSISKPKIIEDIKRNFIIKDCKRNLERNVLLFQQFSVTKIKATNGRISNVRRIYSQLRKLFEDIVMHLEVDITELEGEFIERVLSDSKYSNPTREHFLNYIKYVYTNTGKQMDKEYVLSRKNKLDSKDINTERYSVEEYESFIYLVKDIERHVNKALESRAYANMWVLVTMLLTTAWRPSDIIYEMPRVNINTIGILDLTWFTKHRLTKEQSHLILQQLHLLLGNSVTSKTSKPLRLLVSPDMVEPLIYSIVISELHAKVKEVETKEIQNLLGSFLTRITKEPLTSGYTKHLKFLNSINMERNFQSSKLHNSTMTYLFLDIAEDQEFSELSIETIGWMRSHTDLNTTATYIKLVNKDGTLDRVSVNLFKRGHFGWLYNYMIHLAYSNLKFSQTIEQRTNTILDLRNEFSPIEIEQWAKALGDFDSRKNNIIRKLSLMDEVHLRNLLLKVFKCKMPSRDGCGQCIVYPNCIYKNRKKCMGCENFIPQFYEVLIEAKKEFYRLVNSIEVAQTENILIRDSRLFLNVLMLFNEAANSFGIEIINSYLTVEERANSIKKISAKLRI